MFIVIYLGFYMVVFDFYVCFLKRFILNFLVMCYVMLCYDILLNILFFFIGLLVSKDF